MGVAVVVVGYRVKGVKGVLHQLNYVSPECPGGHTAKMITPL
jgi:hypothetical protein